MPYLTPDDWLSVFALTGVTLYFFAYYQLYFGKASRMDLGNRMLRFMALTLILLPLFVRWYLDASLLCAIGIGMATVSGAYLGRQRLKEARS